MTTQNKRECPNPHDNPAFPSECSLCKREDWENKLEKEFNKKFGFGVWKTGRILEEKELFISDILEFFRTFIAAERAKAQKEVLEKVKEELQREETYIYGSAKDLFAQVKHSLTDRIKNIAFSLGIELK